MGYFDNYSSLFHCNLSPNIQRKQLFTCLYAFIFDSTWNLYLSWVCFPSVWLPFNNPLDGIRITIRKCILLKYQNWSRSTCYFILPNSRWIYFRRHSHDGKRVLESYVHSFQGWLPYPSLYFKLCDFILLEVRY